MPSFSSNRVGPPGFDAQANFFTELTRGAYAFARQLGELNLRLTQQLMEDAAEASRQVMACTNPVQALTVAAGAGQPAVEHLYNYQQRVASLVAGVQHSASLSTAHQQSAGPGAPHRLAGGDTLTNASRADSMAGATGYTH
jgi:phasin family protein